MTLNDWRNGLGIVKVGIAIFLVGISAGWGGYKAFLAVADKDEVTHGSYILKEYLNDNYVPMSEHQKDIAAVKTLKEKLSQAEAERDDLGLKIKKIDDKNVHKEELENQRAELQQRLRDQQRALGMLIEMEKLTPSFGDAKTLNTSEAISQKQNELIEIKNQISEINKYLLEH